MKIKKRKILVLVDHAKGIDGPHRNVVNSLNSLSLLKNIELTLLTGEIDKNEKYYSSSNVNIILNFSPKNIKRLFYNYTLCINYIMKNDLVYVPTNLTSYLYALFGGAVFKKFIVGPNVAGIPGLMRIHNPNKIMTTFFVNKWLENSYIRKLECMKFGTNSSQIRIIPHSIDTDDFSPRKRDKSIWNKYGLEQNRLKILHVGRADERIKATKEVIEVFKKLNTNNEYDFIYVGKKGKFWNKEFEQIQGFKYLGQIHGSELRNIYASSDVFFALSYSESFWMTPLEAMSSGLPIVVNSVGAVSTMVPIDKREGVIVKIFNDDNQLKENYVSLCVLRLEELLKNESLRKKISVKARLHVLKKFSLFKMSKRFEKLFRDI